MAAVAHPTRDQLADELGRAFHQRQAQHRRARVAGLDLLRLQGVHVLVRDHVDETVLRIRMHEVRRAQRLQADDGALRTRHAHRPAAADHDRHRRILRLRVELRQAPQCVPEPPLHRRQHRQAAAGVLVHRRVGLQLGGDPLAGDPAQAREHAQAVAALREVDVQLVHGGAAARGVVQRIEAGDIPGVQLRSGGRGARTGGHAARRQEEEEAEGRLHAAQATPRRPCCQRLRQAATLPGRACAERNPRPIPLPRLDGAATP